MFGRGRAQQQFGGFGMIVGRGDEAEQLAAAEHGHARGFVREQAGSVRDLARREIESFAAEPRFERGGERVRLARVRPVEQPEAGVGGGGGEDAVNVAGFDLHGRPGGSAPSAPFGGTSPAPRERGEAAGISRRDCRA